MMIQHYESGPPRDAMLAPMAVDRPREDQWRNWCRQLENELGIERKTFARVFDKSTGWVSDWLNHKKGRLSLDEEHRLRMWVAQTIDVLATAPDASDPPIQSAAKRRRTGS